MNSEDCKCRAQGQIFRSSIFSGRSCKLPTFQLEGSWVTSYSCRCLWAWYSSPLLVLLIKFSVFAVRSALSIFQGQKDYVWMAKLGQTVPHAWLWICSYWAALIRHLAWSHEHTQRNTDVQLLSLKQHFLITDWKRQEWQHTEVEVHRSAVLGKTEAGSLRPACRVRGEPGWWAWLSYFRHGLRKNRTWESFSLKQMQSGCLSGPFICFLTKFTYLTLYLGWPFLHAAQMCILQRTRVKLHTIFMTARCWFCQWMQKGDQ